MLKKFLIFNLFLTAVLGGATNLFALRWGIFGNYPKTYSNYGLYKFIHNIPIKYYISDITEQKQNTSGRSNNTPSQEELQNQLKFDLNKERKQTELKTIIEQSFHLWITQTKDMIQKSKRSQEFSDILPYLSKPILPQRTSNIDNADIIFYFTTKDILIKECGEDHPGCIEIEDDIAEVYLPNPYIKDEQSYEKRKEILFLITIHELGHYFGLADQYDQDNEFFNASVLYSTSDRICNLDSVMSGSYDKSLSCDDIDGFINLIDLTLASQRGSKFSERAKKGWASFCNGKKNGQGKLFKKTYYQEGKPINRENYHRGSTIYNYDQVGNVKDWKNIHLFDLYKNKATYFNDGTLFQVTNNNGIKYTYYHYIDEGKIDIFIETSKEEPLGFSLERLANHWESLNSSYRFDISIANQCHLKERFFTTAENFNAVFAYDILNSYTYELKYRTEGSTGLKKTAPFKFTITQDHKCFFEQNNTHVLTFDIKNNQLINNDQQKLNDLAGEVNISSNKITEEAVALCKKLFNEDVKRDRETCKYFTILENKL